RAKDAVHLAERGARQREILERGLADDEVEGFGFEWKVGYVALAKVDADSCQLGVVAADLDEGMADVQRCHIEATKTSHFDGQVSGAGGDFQHLGAVRQPSREVGSLPSVRFQLALRSAHPRVPPGNRSFHLWTLESPSPRFHGLHLHFSFI